MIRYIASDLDGTILLPDAQKPEPIYYDLIRQLNEKSIRFIAASGRQYQNMRRMFAPIQDQISYIAENGSMCVHDGKVISTGLIDRDLGHRIFLEARDFPDCGYMLSCARTMYTDSKNQEFISHLRDVVGYELEVVDDLCEITEPYLKFAICDFRGTDRILPYFREKFRSEIKVVTSGNIWIDFVAPNANKGSALAGLCRYFGFSPEDGIAFGDQENDIEMLETAGISYAMSTCAPGVEAHADRRTASVAGVITRILKTL